MIPAALTQRWNALSARERVVFLSGAILGVLSLGYVLIVDPSLERRDRMNRQIFRAERQQAELRVLGAQAATLRARLAGVEAKLEAAKGRFALLPFLEEAANAALVRDRVTAMQPQPTTPAQGYKETAVEVKLEGVQLRELLALLMKLEDSPYLLQVKRVQFRPRFDSPHLLEATVLVSTHEKV